MDGVACHPDPVRNRANHSIGLSCLQARRRGTIARIGKWSCLDSSCDALELEERPTRYSLCPFTSFAEAGGPDLHSRLRESPRRPRRENRFLSSLELLDQLVPVLRETSLEILVDQCDEEDGDLRIAVFVPGVRGDVSPGDRLHAGFFLQNSEQGRFETVACARIFRVACSNGALMECERGQSVTLSAQMNWRSELSKVVDRSFSLEGLDRDIMRFRQTVQQILISPYEILCNLVAQGILTDDEQSAVQREFDDVGDLTLYGFINAVTRIAAECRESDEWKRWVDLERLGGEIARGDHQLPAMEPAYR